MAYVYIIAFYFIVTTGLIISTALNKYEVDKRKDIVLVNLQRDLNSEIIFGVIFLLISFFSFYFWYDNFLSLRVYLTEYGYMETLSKMFDKDYLSNLHSYLYRHDAFDGMLLIDNFIGAINYFLISSIYLYIALILFFRGLQRGYITSIGIHTVHFNFLWDSVSEYKWEENNENYSIITIHIKGIEDKIRLKLLNKDREVLEALIKEKVKTSFYNK